MSEIDNQQRRFEHLTAANAPRTVRVVDRRGDPAPKAPRTIRVVVVESARS